MKMSAKDIVIGVDLGGTKAALAVYDRRGRELSSGRKATVRSSAAATVRQLGDLISEQVSKVARGRSDVKAIGIGVPGVTSPANGVVTWAPNLPGWRNLPLARLLGKRYPARYAIENDVDAAAIGEHWRGSGRGVENMVFIAVGTGIGSGIIIDGNLYRGTRGVAGAIGWSVPGLAYLRRKQHQGIGALEMLAAGPGIAQRAKQALRGKRGGKILDLAGGQLSRVSAREVFSAGAMGDRLAKRLIEETGEYLGLGVANTVSMLDPEVVLLGGGVSEGGSELLRVIKRVVKDMAQPLSARRCKIRKARLGEAAGVVGAAKLALDLAKR